LFKSVGRKFVSGGFFDEGKQVLEDEVALMDVLCVCNFLKASGGRSLNQLQGGPAHRGLDGIQLLEDLMAVALISEHGLHTAHLAFNAPQALKQFVAGVVVFKFHGVLFVGCTAARVSSQLR